ncbi:hypothetical protein J6590_015550 [Homalodisca vitripennis]|nr:hypothetical protein J6590_015550 [Homalodisca vitripennis]
MGGSTGSAFKDKVDSQRHVHASSNHYPSEKGISPAPRVIGLANAQPRSVSDNQEVTNNRMSTRSADIRSNVSLPQLAPNPETRHGMDVASPSTTRDFFSINLILFGYFISHAYLNNQP